jgi:RsiW-degrading membrane proteinase PrsW (M82 family)
MTTYARARTRSEAPRRTWLRVFGVGLVLWVLSAVVIYTTGNPNLIPTLVLLGSFLIPVTFVVWAFERRDSGEITAELVFRTFLVGGVLGVLGASVLEAYLLHPSPWLYVEVGVIEEAVKLAALALLTRRLAAKSIRDGMILGAAVGFGFAALESAGYALTALFTPQGLSLENLVTTELLRGILSPVGHGLWTAILGGILFSRSTRTHFVLTGRLIAAFIGVSILHALWDMMPNVAALLTLLLTGQSWQYQLLLHGWLVLPSDNQVRLYAVFSWGGLVVLGMVGLLWLGALARGSRRELPAAQPWMAYRWATERR